MFSWIFAIPAIIILAVTILLCVFRGVKKSCARLVTLLIAFFISIPLATLIAKAASGAVGNLITGLLSGMPEAEQLLSASPTLALTPAALAGVLVAPIIYLVVFIAVALLCLLLYKLANKLAQKIPNIENKVLDRSVGAAVGLVCALVIIVGIYAPISGYLGIANDTLAKLEENAPEYAESVPAVAKDALVSCADSAVVKVSDAIGGKALFNGISRGKLDGQKFTLASELDAITDVAFALPAFMEAEVAEYDAQQKNSVDTIAASLPESTLLVSIVPEILSGASDAWLSGEAFIGIAKPELDEAFAGIFDKLLFAFTSSDSSNIAGDLATVAELFDIIIDKEILANIENTEELIKIFSDSATTSALIKAVAEGPSKDRLSFLIPEITNLGLSVVYSSLGIPETNEDVNHNFVHDVTETISKVSALPFDEMVDDLSAQLVQVAHDYALPVPDSELDAIAFGLAYDFNGVENITEEDVSSFLLTYASYITSEGGDITAVPVSADAIRFIIYTGEDEAAPEGMMITFAGASGLDQINNEGVYEGVILTSSSNSITVAKGKASGAMIAAQLAKGVKADELPEGTFDEHKKDAYNKVEEKHKDTREEPKLYTRNESTEEGGHKLNTRIPTQEDLMWSGEGLEDEGASEKLGEVVAKAATIALNTNLEKADTQTLTTFGSVLDVMNEVRGMDKIADGIVTSAFIVVLEQIDTTLTTNAKIDMAEGIISLTAKNKDKGNNGNNGNGNGNNGNNGNGNGNGNKTDKPAVTTAAPVVTTTAPVTTATAPVTTTTAAVTTTTTPVVTTTVPVTTTAAPVTTQKPAQPQNPSGDMTYEDVFGLAGTLFEYMQLLSNPAASQDDKIYAIEDMLSTLGSNEASVLAAVMSDTLLMSLGIPSKYADLIVDPLRDMFNRFAETSVYRDDRLALNLLFELMFSGNDPTDTRPMFNMDGKRGQLGVTAEYVIKTVDASTITAETMAEIIYACPDFTLKFTDMDKYEMAVAASEHCWCYKFREAILSMYDAE